MNEELFEIIDDVSGNVIGTAPRSRCHGDPSLIHRAVHIAVFHPDGRILLQKRSMQKDIQPGKWDTAVGGHLMPGETYEIAAKRELQEELGVITDLPLIPLFEYKIRNERESENVQVFSLVYAGPFKIQESELDEIRFFEPDDLKQRMQEGGISSFTPVLQRELELLFKDPELLKRILTPESEHEQ